MEKEWVSQSHLPSPVDPFQRLRQGFTSEGEKNKSSLEGFRTKREVFF